MIDPNPVLIKHGWTREQIIHTPLIEGRPWVFLRIGHGRHNGAQWQGMEEHAYYLSLVDDIMQTLPDGVNVVITDRYRGQSWTGECCIVDELGGPDALDIQLHLNMCVWQEDVYNDAGEVIGTKEGGNRNANGTFIVYTKGSPRGKRAAEIMLPLVCDALGTVPYKANGGYVANPDPDWPRVDLTRRTQGPSILVEAACMSNDHDFSMLKTRKKEFAAAISETIRPYFNL